MKKLSSEFIGRQLSRLKAGQSYYVIITTTFTALGVLNMAFPLIPTWLLILAFPITLVGTFLIGYFMDVRNINVNDYKKSVEMTQRYLNIVDIKMQEFRLTELRIFRRWFIAMQKGEPLEESVIDEEYNIFIQRWRPPKEEEKE